MKKILALALALIMVFSMVACGSTKKADEAKGPQVTVFWYDESDVFMGVVRDAMNKEFEALEITPDNQFAANNQTTQLDRSRPPLPVALTFWSSIRSLPVPLIPLRISLLPPVTPPSSSSTVPSVLTAPSCPFWKLTRTSLSSALTLPSPATCRAR